MCPIFSYTGSMLITRQLDTDEKLDVLALGAEFDICGCGRRTPPSPLRFIYNAALPQGGCVPLFKVLQSNACINDCAYCVNQAGRDIPRSALTSEELARIFMELYRKKLVQGLFLTSAVDRDASRMQQAMIKTVEVLRRSYHFTGYIHLKMLPGATRDLIEAGCRLASRVSVNMEAPTATHLARLSSKKDIYNGILEPMRWARQIMAGHDNLVPSGQTTQFVVGAAGETDRDILKTTTGLYQEIGLRRIYFSAYSPIGGSRLEGVPPAPPMREHRLYEVDWLLRVYGFSAREVELALDGSGHLRLSQDPKLTIARKQPWLYPVDVNTAPYDDLVRVPGVGPVSARRIVSARRGHSIDSLDQLKKMRVVVRRAVPFLWFKGMMPEDRQLSFLPERDEESPEPAPSLDLV